MPRGKYVFAYLANASSGQLYYNTAQVNPKELASYYDLFKSKWKGRIVTLDPRPRTEIGTTMQFFYYHPELGRRLFGSCSAIRRLLLAATSGQMIDWLATRESFRSASVAPARSRPRIKAARRECFDTSLWKEGASFSVGGGTVSTPSRAPHPNAAKVFTNWYLSRRGQMALQKLADPRPAAQLGAHRYSQGRCTRCSNKLIDGRKYFDASRPEFEDIDSAFKIAVQAMERAFLDRGKLFKLKLTREKDYPWNCHCSITRSTGWSGGRAAR